MSASVATILGSLPAGHIKNRSKRVIVVSAEVAAEKKQVLYALTLPEYLEAWITPADAHRRHARVVTRSGPRYILEYRDLNGQVVIVDGVFRPSASNSVVFTWCRQWPCRTRRSLVNIAVNGCDGFVTVTLTHGGVMSDAEYCWLHESWSTSLARFKSLFQLASNNAFQVPPPRPCASCLATGCLHECEKKPCARCGTWL